ncbi:MAG: TonB-dependent receptor, partial [Bacteroidetes bacterium]|nr:TonB-dependent receptor [Fibrella sp.]
MNALLATRLRWAVFFFSLTTVANAQNTGVILGTAKDKRTQEPLAGATIVADGTPNGTTTDAEGRYRLTLPTGTYTLRATLLGYQPATKFNVVLSSGNSQQLTFDLDETTTDLAEVQVKVNRSIQVASLETPNSVQRLTAEEIKANPGSNGDISRVIQTLPGVAAASANGFRNDLNIRGGASGENVYYLDGIEIPTINHFSTQGATGGPQGIINPIFIEDATLSSSSFNARYDNPLSAVLQLRQREG